MIRLSLIPQICLLSSIAIISTAPLNAGDGMSLFDGNTLNGWEGETKEIWRVENGAIVGGSLKRSLPRNEFLATVKEYENFDLRLKVKLVGAGSNCGIQFRSKRVPSSSEVSGFQADFAPGYYGALYDEIWLSFPWIFMIVYKVRFRLEEILFLTLYLGSSIGLLTQGLSFNNTSFLEKFLTMYLCIHVQLLIFSCIAYCFDSNRLIRIIGYQALASIFFSLMGLSFSGKI